MMKIYFPDLLDQSYENRYANFFFFFYRRFVIDELCEIIREKSGLSYGFDDMNMGNEKLGLSGFFTTVSAENMEKCVALIAKNSYKIYTENKISDVDLDRYVRRAKLSDADWLESSERRAGRLVDFYSKHGRLYDFYDTVKMSNSINRDDAIKHSHGLFDGEMSIITQGADFDVDLKNVWEENFK
jgi:predicted Zn-dependent peptidase